MATQPAKSHVCVLLEIDKVQSRLNDIQGSQYHNPIRILGLFNDHKAGLVAAANHLADQQGAPGAPDDTGIHVHTEMKAPQCYDIVNTVYGYVYGKTKTVTKQVFLSCHENTL